MLLDFEVILIDQSLGPRLARVTCVLDLDKRVFGAHDLILQLLHS